MPDSDDQKIIGAFNIMVGPTAHENPITISIMADIENGTSVLEHMAADKNSQVARSELHT
jgi:hypothetical protein